MSYFSKSLPNEVLVHIFSFLREKELCRIEQVCKTFQQIALLESLWSVLITIIQLINNNNTA